jgi:hypothetical protein
LFLGDKVNYSELRKIDVSKHIEKKNGLSYLSWAWAVDTLLQNDPTATWEYGEPRMFGDTMMVFCTVTAFGVSRTAQLPVMDHRNRAISQPDAFSVNTAMQRVLTKAIAITTGLGLSLYAGEDVWQDEQQESATLTEEDVEKIRVLADEVGSSIEKIAKFYKVESLTELPRLRYGSIIATLNKKRLTNAGVQHNE